MNAAANELGYAQSTVTQHIQQLENQVGIELFQRNGKRLIATEAGRLLRDSAVGLLRHASDVRTSLAQFASGVSGNVRLGCVEPFVNVHLARILREFVRDSESVMVSVEVSAEQALYRSLRSGTLDFLIASETYKTEDIAFESLLIESLCYLLPAEHRLASYREIGLADLAGEPLIVEDSQATRRVLGKAFLHPSCSPLPFITINSLEGRKAAVQAGLGIAIVPASGVTPPPPKTVLRRPVGWDAIMKIGVARRKGVDATPATQRLERMLRAFLAQHRERTVVVSTEKPSTLGTKPDCQIDIHP